MKFKKITAIATSVLMAGMTVGMAAAANYPAPFVDDGMADVAVVYGTGAGVSSLDQVNAGNIQSSLASYTDSDSSTTVEGGEEFELKKSSNNFNYGENLDSIYNSLDSQELDFLADGVYDDRGLDVEYEQEIQLSEKKLELFADRDYNDEEPTVGFHWDNDEILSYVMTFDESITFSEMEETDLPLLGATYYVLSASGDTMELLDSAEKNVLSEGETITVDGKSVSISYVSDTQVKFEVDGELTDLLETHDTFELEDGSYIIANEILYTAKETGVSKVEFSIGAGKMVLEDNREIEVNDERVDGLYADFDSTTDLTSITIRWESYRDSFLTEDDSLTMPLFNAVTLVYNGLDYPNDSEMISIESGEQLTLVMDSYDLPLMFFDKDVPSTNLGADGYDLLLEPITSTVDYQNGTHATGTLTEGLEVEEDDRFLVTSMDDDLTDIDTVYYEVSYIDYRADDDFVVELRDLIGTNDLEFDDFEDHDRGDVNIELLGVNDTKAYFNFTTYGDLAFNKAVSEKGLVVELPTDVSITSDDAAENATLIFTEADKDEDVEGGTSFNATVKLTSNDKLHVSRTTVDTKETSNDKYIGVVESDLASKVSMDQSGDEYDFDIEYFGKEVPADVRVAAGAEVSTSTTGALGDILIKDSEVADSDAESFIIVGGSCINSAAATVLGGAYCGEAFTEATDVSSGEFLIKGFEDALDGKFALVVAGYEAADTTNAATYLTKKTVDTSMAYKGTSATEDALVIN